MRPLFVDTAGWVACADAADPLHGKAIAARDGWLEAGGILLTTDYVADETLTLLFGRAVRSHWGVENKVHWVMDVTFREDLSRARAGYASENLATLRRLALNMEGRQEGAIFTRQHAVLDAIEIRFGEVADAIRQRIEDIQDEGQLRALLKSAIQAGSIDEFTQAL